MREYLAQFEQSNFRAWMWIIIMILSVIQAVILLFAGQGMAALFQLSIAFLIYWIDKLEKEVTYRNKQDKTRGKV